MGTSIDKHLRDREGESLARAKAALKGRLRQKMVQEVLDEMQNTEPLVEDALSEITAREADLLSVKAAFKAQLLDHVRQQAVAEVVAEINATPLGDERSEGALDAAKEAVKKHLIDDVRRHALEEACFEVKNTPPQADDEHLAAARQVFKDRLRDEAVQQVVDDVSADFREASDALVAQAEGSGLAEARAVFKKRLLDHVLQQAIAEIDAEVDIDSEDLGDTLGVALDESDLELDESDLDEAALQVAEEVERGDLDAMIDMDFWHDEPEAEGDEDTDLPEALTFPEDGIDEIPEGDDENFFLSSPSESGGDCEAASGADIDTLLDFTGDGTWQTAGPLDESWLPGETEEGPDDVAEERREHVYYLYGVLSGQDIAEDALPKQGLDPAFPIYALPYKHAQALLSMVPADTYYRDALSRSLLDPVWMEEHVRIHEAIVDRIAQHGAFLPVPFGTVYESEAEVRRMLSEISYLEALEKIQGRSQWRVRLYRNVEALHQQVVEKSEAVKNLMAEIKSNPRGGAQSIKKQMVSTIHEEEASITDNCTKEVHERLFALSDDLELGVLEGPADRDTVELILDATYLVQRGRHDAFVEDVERMKAEYKTLGFEFEVSGPEPPTLFSRLHPVAGS